MAETNAYSDRHPEPTKENEKGKRELSLCLHAFPFSFLHSCILGLKASLSPPYGSCDFCVSRFQDTNGSGGRGSGWPRILFYLLLLLGPEVEEALKDPHLEEEGGRSNGGKAVLPWGTLWPPQEGTAPTSLHGNLPLLLLIHLVPHAELLPFHEPLPPGCPQPMTAPGRSSPMPHPPGCSSSCPVLLPAFPPFTAVTSGSCSEGSPHPPLFLFSSTFTDVSPQKISCMSHCILASAS